MRQADQFHTSICFLKKIYMRQKQMICSLVSITFDSPQVGKQLKQNIYNFRILIHRYAQFVHLHKFQNEL